jgi:UDP-N-acetylglucosamine--N-acetylmuramyl-(pentapeptide) pyrophosphoryl-undecaprenol N-acetylglucosamine transferase
VPHDQEVPVSNVTAAPDDRPPVVFLAGGGSGGHIFPNIAIANRLAELGLTIEPFFMVSQRPLDARILKQANQDFAPLPVKPFSSNPLKMFSFYSAYRKSVYVARELIKRRSAKAVVATGGFAAAPVVDAARREGVDTVLVNLDAVPGKANRIVARHATKTFTVYESPILDNAQLIGLPLRRVALGPDDQGDARAQLGLDPDLFTLLAVGGSQGAQSINLTMLNLAGREAVQHALHEWQILHICGPAHTKIVTQTYKQLNDAGASLRIKVVGFCDTMGLAWRSANLAISRAGANGVGEAWANVAPTIFLPYPMHRDQHQRHNARPMVATGGAIMLTDLTDPARNAHAMEDTLIGLLTDRPQLATMSDKLGQARPTDGAVEVAQWLVARLCGQQ